MGNQEREADMHLGDAEMAASWPVAELDASARGRLMAHAAEVVEIAAIQDVFDATAPRFDDLARARLIRAARNTPMRQQSWPWRSALATAAATLLAVVATGQWQQPPKPSATLHAIADTPAAASMAGDRPGKPPLFATALDEPAELAAVLPGLDQVSDSEEFAADESGEAEHDLGAGLDALHGVQSEEDADFEAI